MSFSTKRAYASGLVTLVTFTVLACAASCSDQDTVVKDPGNASASPSPTAPGSPTPHTSQVAEPSPASGVPGTTPSVPGSAEGPAGGGQGGGARGGGLSNVTRTPYKPTPTPGDPLPPRPTPPIIMENGMIKQHWQAPAEARDLSNPYKDNPDAAKLGQFYYNQRCVDCHGQRGYGNGFMSQTFKPKPTNLASKVVQANTDGELFWKITNGRSPMPANRVRFTDDQRWYIVAFLRTLK
jgi:mono/diheme cytochrome c family protein